MPDDTRKSTTGMEGEENVYSVVYHVLLVGMYASTALFALGILVALLHPHFFPLDRAWILEHYTWQNFSHGITHAHPVALMLAATALLILTPVMRVVASIYAFAVDRDFKYVFITSLVLAIMALTVVLGLLGLR
jgi:uncharacterized membrane protein